ncbi:MAG: AglZ/HisF2 family acetamidino modification protein [Steroidobacteraceae bacterium]|nr:imidazole glycerol phosphate synthase subunit HisF [Pseudomonadota bacterium]MBP6106651.1 imidazole glycerol phosphate synthase subunit HisF [Steroidobacteraceae bacterium]MBP7013272.1 imidazole glycerol phosphate synthase subunit HisF [Steroidobacteraceae bacterium]
MLRTRVIPCLLLRNGGLVKTVKFGEAKYVGDPINAVKIFNEKEVDELVFLDITATAASRGPNFELIRDIATEAFMPFGYGGGITTIDQVASLVALGVEKVVLNTSVVERPEFIREAANLVGSSSVVVSIDVKRSLLGRYEVVTRNAGRKSGLDPIEWARRAADLGAGEVLLTSVDRDGTQKGYDLALLRQVTEAVSIPVIASGGAGSLDDFRAAVQEAGASAVAAGSLFVFHGKHRAVLITYPDYRELEKVFG